MRPGAPVPVATLARLAGSGTSSSRAPAGVLPDSTDTSDPERHSSAASQIVALVEGRPIALRDLETFLALQTRVVGPKLVCLAGLVALADDPGRPLVLQPGRAAAYPLRRLATWPSPDRRTRLIAVTHDLDPAVLQRLFATATRPWPDRMRMRIAMVASAALVVIFLAGLALALYANARTMLPTSSPPPWTQNRGS
jgi:hypothetical protein